MTPIDGGRSCRGERGRCPVSLGLADSETNRADHLPCSGRRRSPPLVDQTRPPTPSTRSRAARASLTLRLNRGKVPDGDPVDLAALDHLDRPIPARPRRVAAGCVQLLDDLGDFEALASCGGLDLLALKLRKDETVALPAADSRDADVPNGAGSLVVAYGGDGDLHCRRTLVPEAREGPPVDALHPHERVPRQREIPVIVRGDGCYLEDANGKRYLDALAGLFSVNIGYGFGEEIGQAALEQMRELPFYTNWTYAHPRAIELAAEVASLAPGDLNRAFFVSGGSEAVESAWKLARQYYLARGEKRLRTRRRDAGAGPRAIAANLATPPRRYKAIARTTAYHGTTLGALSLTGIPAIRVPFEPLVPEVRNVRNTNRYHRPEGETEEEFTAVLLDELERTILAMGPETAASSTWSRCRTRAARSRRPVGYWQGVRELCDRYDILLSADEVITGFGRIGRGSRSERYDIRPDIVTSAKGLSSSYARDRRGDRDRPGRWSRSSRGPRCTRTGSRSAATRCSARSRSRTSRS